MVGSFGFIGSSLKLALSDKHEVHGADIFIESQKNYTSVINPELLVNLIKVNRYDLIINCSGSANVQFSFDLPFEDYNLNVSNVFYIWKKNKHY